MQNTRLLSLITKKTNAGKILKLVNQPLQDYLFFKLLLFLFIAWQSKDFHLQAKIFQLDIHADAY